MKVRASIKRICSRCRITTRNGHHLVTCVKPKHKQRQG